MLLTYRICKEEVIADFCNEVKKVETVKLRSSRQTAFLQEMEIFLMVTFSSHVPNMSHPELAGPAHGFCSLNPCLSFLRGPMLNWPKWKASCRS